MKSQIAEAEGPIFEPEKISHDKRPKGEVSKWCTEYTIFVVF